jgi:hypothetical protein
MRRYLMGLLVLLFAALPASVDAQKVSVLGHLAIPIGDFGDDDIEAEQAGFAKMGFGGGLEVSFGTGTPGLSFLGQARIIVNSVEENKLEDGFEEVMDLFWYLLDPDLYLYSLKMETNSYINIPVMGGMRFGTAVSPGVEFYGKGLVGVNFVRIPKYDISMVIYDAYYDVFGDADATIEPDGMSTSFCFSLGGGLTINDRFHIGFEYLNLGEPEGDGSLDVSVEGYQILSEDVQFKQPISMIVIMGGVSF